MSFGWIFCIPLSRVTNGSNCKVTGRTSCGRRGRSLLLGAPGQIISLPPPAQPMRPASVPSASCAAKNPPNFPQRCSLSGNMACNSSLSAVRNTRNAAVMASFSDLPTETAVRVEVRVPRLEHGTAAVAGQGDRARSVGELPRRDHVVPRVRVAAEAVDQRADQRTVLFGATTSLMNSSRVASSRNTPRTPLVTSRASCAPTPRAAMHMCRPSM